MKGEKRILGLLNEAVANGVFPGAVLLVSRSRKRLFFEAAGNAALVPSPRVMTSHTLFDLASLTKPLATSLAVLCLVSEGALHPDANLAELLPSEFIPADKAQITLRQLLCHCSGLPAWRPYYLHLERLDPSARQSNLRRQILNEPLEYGPGSHSLYSDLGFLLIQWIVERRSGMDLHRFSEEHLFKPLGCILLGYQSGHQGAARNPHDFAATERCPWRGRILSGEVHDENTHVLGGVAGHSGLFGTAPEIMRVLDTILDTLASRITNPLWSSHWLAEFLRPARLDPLSTWALGFDTPADSDSSSGRYFSADTVGHLGFTGTSFWLDLQREMAVVLLTNRIHPTRANEKIRQFRPLIHDAVMEEFG